MRAKWNKSVLSDNREGAVGCSCDYPDVDLWLCNPGLIALLKSVHFVHYLLSRGGPNLLGSSDEV